MMLFQSISLAMLQASTSIFRGDEIKDKSLKSFVHLLFYVVYLVIVLDKNFCIILQLHGVVKLRRVVDVRVEGDVIDTWRVVVLVCHKHANRRL